MLDISIIPCYHKEVTVLTLRLSARQRTSWRQTHPMWGGAVTEPRTLSGSTRRKPLVCVMIHPFIV